jgi:hypothetical protein
MHAVSFQTLNPPLARDNELHRRYASGIAEDGLRVQHLSAWLANQIEVHRTICRSAAASALDDTFKKRTISRAKRPRCRVGGLGALRQP